jgi:hypothetical protein
LLTPEEIQNMFLTKNDGGLTVWHAAAWTGNLELLCKLWEWAKQLLTREEIQNMFRTKHDDGWTVWHAAAWSANKKIIST